MNKKERLKLYKKALEDWSADTFESHLCYMNVTYSGFCWYFRKVHDIKDIHALTFKEILPELYRFRTQKEGSSFFWNGQGSDGQEPFGLTHNGREERVEALKKAIELLESSWLKRMCNKVKSIISRKNESNSAKRL